MYVKRLSERTGKQYQLPSEAEWEYAAKAGSRTRWSSGDEAANLSENAWFFDNSRTGTQKVATRKPNAWGLYDLHGNVMEWVHDAWHDNYEGGPTDGSVWPLWTVGDPPRRVLRGGGWGNSPQELRAARRLWYSPVSRYFDTGLRAARSP